MASTETKWTPGPWEHGPGYDGQAVIYLDRGLGNHIAYISNGGVPEEAEAANARLIAAAPDLYEALAHAVGLIERPEGKAIRDDESWKMYGPAFHAALAKAEGR